MAALDLLDKVLRGKACFIFGLILAGEGSRTCGDRSPGGHQDIEPAQDQVYGHGRERCLQVSLNDFSLIAEAAVDHPGIA